MNKKLISLVMPVSLLVFGLIFAGCDTGGGNGGGGGGETWSPVTDMNQVQGTWKGTASETKTLKALLQLYDQYDSLDADTQKAVDKISVKADGNATYEVAGQSVTLVTGKITYTLTDSGTYLGSFWSTIKTDIENSLKNEFGTGTGINYTSSSSSPYTTSVTFNNVDAAGYLKSDQWEINNTGTKVRLPANVWYKGAPELILTK